MNAGYTVEQRSAQTVLSGVLRLESVDAYDKLLGAALQHLASAQGPYTLDLTGVSLMNSSGIRALANLVLAAKREGAQLIIKGDGAVHWQRKTLASLGALYERLTLQLR